MSKDFEANNSNNQANSNENQNSNETSSLNFPGCKLDKYGNWDYSKRSAFGFGYDVTKDYAYLKPLPREKKENQKIEIENKETKQEKEKQKKKLKKKIVEKELEKGQKQEQEQEQDEKKSKGFYSIKKKRTIDVSPNTDYEELFLHPDWSKRFNGEFGNLCLYNEKGFLSYARYIDTRQLNKLQEEGARLYSDRSAYMLRPGEQLTSAWVLRDKKKKDFSNLPARAGKSIGRKITRATASSIQKKIANQESIKIEKKLENSNKKKENKIEIKKNVIKKEKRQPAEILWYRTNVFKGEVNFEEEIGIENKIPSLKNIIENSKKLSELLQAIIVTKKNFIEIPKFFDQFKEDMGEGEHKKFWFKQFVDYKTISNLIKNEGLEYLIYLVEIVASFNDEKLNKNFKKALQKLSLTDEKSERNKQQPSEKKIVAFYGALLSHVINPSNLKRYKKSLRPWLALIKIDLGIDGSVAPRNLGEIFDLALFGEKAPFPKEKLKQVLPALLNYKALSQWLSKDPLNLYYAFVFARCTRRTERFVALLSKVKGFDVNADKVQDLLEVYQEILNSSDLWGNKNKKLNGVEKVVLEKAFNTISITIKSNQKKETIVLTLPQLAMIFREENYMTAERLVDIHHGILDLNKNASSVQLKLLIIKDFNYYQQIEIVAKALLTPSEFKNVKLKLMDQCLTLFSFRSETKSCEFTLPIKDLLRLDQLGEQFFAITESPRPIYKQFNTLKIFELLEAYFQGNWTLIGKYIREDIRLYDTLMDELEQFGIASSKIERHLESHCNLELRNDYLKKNQEAPKVIRYSSIVVCKHINSNQLESLELFVFLKGKYNKRKYLEINTTSTSFQNNNLNETIKINEEKEVQQQIKIFHKVGKSLQPEILPASTDLQQLILKVKQLTYAILLNCKDLAGKILLDEVGYQAYTIIMNSRLFDENKMGKFWNDVKNPEFLPLNISILNFWRPDLKHSILYLKTLKTLYKNNKKHFIFNFESIGKLVGLITNILCRSPYKRIAYTIKTAEDLSRALLLLGQKSPKFVENFQNFCEFYSWKYTTVKYIFPKYLHNESSLDLKNLSYNKVLTLIKVAEKFKVTALSEKIKKELKMEIKTSGKTYSYSLEELARNDLKYTGFYYKEFGNTTSKTLPVTSEEFELYLKPFIENGLDVFFDKVDLFKNKEIKGYGHTSYVLKLFSFYLKHNLQLYSKLWKETLYLPITFPGHHSVAHLNKTSLLLYIVKSFVGEPWLKAASEKTIDSLCSDLERISESLNVIALIDQLNFQLSLGQKAKEFTHFGVNLSAAKEKIAALSSGFVGLLELKDVFKKYPKLKINKEFPRFIKAIFNAECFDKAVTLQIISKRFNLSKVYKDWEGDCCSSLKTVKDYLLPVFLGGEIPIVATFEQMCARVRLLRGCRVPESEIKKYYNQKVYFIPERKHNLQYLVTLNDFNKEYLKNTKLHLNFITSPKHGGGYILLDYSSGIIKMLLKSLVENYVQKKHPQAFLKFVLTEPGLYLSYAYDFLSEGQLDCKELFSDLKKAKLELISGHCYTVAQLVDRKFFDTKDGYSQLFGAINKKENFEPNASLALPIQVKDQEVISHIDNYIKQGAKYFETLEANNISKLRQALKILKFREDFVKKIILDIECKPYKKQLNEEKFKLYYTYRKDGSLPKDYVGLYEFFDLLLKISDAECFAMLKVKKIFPIGSQKFSYQDLTSKNLGPFFKNYYKYLKDGRPAFKNIDVLRYAIELNISQKNTLVEFPKRYQNLSAVLELFDWLSFFDKQENATFKQIVSNIFYESIPLTALLTSRLLNKLEKKSLARLVEFLQNKVLNQHSFIKVIFLDFIEKSEKNTKSYSITYPGFLALLRISEEYGYFKFSEYFIKNYIKSVISGSEAHKRRTEILAVTQDSKNALPVLEHAVSELMVLQKELDYKPLESTTLVELKEFCSSNTMETVRRLHKGLPKIETLMKRLYTIYSLKKSFVYFNAAKDCSFITKANKNKRFSKTDVNIFPAGIFDASENVTLSELFEFCQKVSLTPEKQKILEGAFKQCKQPWQRAFWRALIRHGATELENQARLFDTLLPFTQDTKAKEEFLRKVALQAKGLGLDTFSLWCEKAVKSSKKIKKTKSFTASDYVNQLCILLDVEPQKINKMEHLALLNLAAKLEKNLKLKKLLEIKLTSLVEQLKHLKKLGFKIQEKLKQLLPCLEIFLKESKKYSLNERQIYFKYEQSRKIFMSVTLKSLIEFSKFILDADPRIQQTFFRYVTDTNFNVSEKLPCESMTEKELSKSLKTASKKGQPYFVRYVLQHLEKKIKLPKFKLELFGKQYKVKKLFISDLEEFNKVYLQKGHRQNMACEFKKQLGIVLLRLIKPSNWKFSSGEKLFSMETATQYLQFIKVLETYKLFTNHLFSKFMGTFDYAIEVNNGVVVKDEGKLVNKLETIDKCVTVGTDRRIVTDEKDNVRKTAPWSPTKN